MAFNYPHIDYDPVDRLMAESDHVWPESDVVLDSGYTLREIVSRFTRGIPVSGHVYSDQASVYDDPDSAPDEEFLDFSSMDIEELESLHRDVSDRISKLKNSTKPISQSSEPPSQTSEASPQGSGT